MKEDELKTIYAEVIPENTSVSDAFTIGWKDGYKQALKEFADRLCEQTTENYLEKKYEYPCADDDDIERIEKELKGKIK